MQFTQKIKKRVQGAALAEYGLLAGLVAVVAVGSVAATGGKIRDTFGSTSSSFGTALGDAVSGNGSGGGGATPPPWEIPSEDLGRPPGGMVLTFDGASVSIGVIDTIGGSTIHWGDGNTTVTNPNAGIATYSHTYGASGEYDAIYEGQATEMRMYSTNLKYVKSFGNVGLQSMRHFFLGNHGVLKVAPLPSTVTNLQEAFRDSNSNPEGVENWDVSNVTNASNMFIRAANFDRNIDDWDFSSIPDGTGISAMFWDASSFTGDLSGWCIPNVTAKPNNFDTNAPNLTSDPVWGWCGAPDFSNAVEFTVETTAPNESVNVLLSAAVNDGAVVRFGDGKHFPLKTLPGGWSSVTSTFAAPGQYKIHIGGDVTGFRVGSKAISLDSFGSVGVNTLFQTFLDADKLASVPTVLPPEITSMFEMMRDADSNPTGLSNWDTSNVTEFTRAFYNTTTFDQDVSNWDVSAASVNADLSGMFLNASAATADLSGWCVDDFPGDPGSFSSGAPNLAALPVWGTCP